jgi:heme exporter protein D
MTNIMDSLSGLLTMGGYAGYVWPAYGISIVVLAGVLVASLLGARAEEADLETLQRTRRARRGAASESPE